MAPMKPLFDVGSIAGSLPPAEPRRPRQRAKAGRSLTRTEAEATIPVRVARVAQLLPGELREGQSVHIVSAGQWSYHDVLQALLSYFTEPPTLFLCTWSSSDSAVRQLARLRESGRIARLVALQDHHASQQRSDAAVFLARVADESGLTAVHAKVSVLLSGDVGITIVGSANLTTNPKVEAGVITRSLPVARFHAGWIRDCIRDGALLQEPKP